MFADSEAAIIRCDDVLAIGRLQYSAEARYAQALGAIAVAYPADAIEFCVPSLNIGPFMRRQSAASIDAASGITVGDGPINPGWKTALRPQTSINIGVRRQHIFVADDVASNPYFTKSRISSSDVDANHFYRNWDLLRNVAHEPKVFDADFGSVTGEKFFFGRIDSAFQLSPLDHADDDQSGGYYAQQSSKNRREYISNFDATRRILGGLFFCSGGIAIQVLGLLRMTSKTVQGWLIWIVGVGLGFAGPIYILWGHVI